MYRKINFRNVNTYSRFNKRTGVYSQITCDDISVIGQIKTNIYMKLISLNCMLFAPLVGLEIKSDMSKQIDGVVAIVGEEIKKFKPLYEKLEAEETGKIGDVYNTALKSLYEMTKKKSLLFKELEIIKSYSTRFHEYAKSFASIQKLLKKIDFDVELLNQLSDPELNHLTNALIFCNTMPRIKYSHGLFNLVLTQLFFLFVNEQDCKIRIGDSNTDKALTDLISSTIYSFVQNIMYDESIDQLLVQLTKKPETHHIVKMSNIYFNDNEVSKNQLTRQVYNKSKLNKYLTFEEFIQLDPIPYLQSIFSNMGRKERCSLYFAHVITTLFKRLKHLNATQYLNIRKIFDMSNLDGYLEQIYFPNREQVMKHAVAVAIVNNDDSEIINNINAFENDFEYKGKKMSLAFKNLIKPFIMEFGKTPLFNEASKAAASTAE